MAKTQCDLYRSVMDKSFKSIKVGIYPGDGILDPRWEDTEYYSNRLGKMVTSKADVETALGENGPEVLPGGGTSLHDVSGWFPTKEFWIPIGTEYSDELVMIKDKKQKTSSYNPNLKGYHYQIECKSRMTVTQMKGYLNNMARAAIVRQCELAKSEN
ncbi:hypothetical protein V8J88_16930 [Massilia sp. W12]|uniref:Tse2 family ADP-ribosyltransferase toxin n=1 Tax=Massilia sp. W12 TaxID=3126507 RepID=UPI0030D0D903